MDKFVYCTGGTMCRMYKLNNVYHSQGDNVHSVQMEQSVECTYETMCTVYRQKSVYSRQIEERNV